MMKKPLILFAAMIVGFVAFAQTGPELLPPKLGDAEDQKRFDREREAYLKANPPKQTQMLPASVKPSEHYKLKIWEQCNALTQSTGFEYRYYEATLLKKYYYNRTPVCFPGDECRKPKPKTDAHFIWHDTQFELQGQKIRLTIPDTAISADKSALKLQIGDKYIFCARYYRGPAYTHDNYVIDHLESLKQED